MRCVQVDLICASPYLTPWRNATLWGRLTWGVANGAAKGWTIEKWLQAYEENRPPLVVSDGFPKEAVPVPALYQAELPHKGKKPKTLPWAAWLELCKNGAWPDVKEEEVPELNRTHVMIGRETGTVGEAALRTEKGWHPKDGILIVAMLSDDLSEDDFRSLVNYLCFEGWGYGLSYGYGAIDLNGIYPLDRPDAGHCVAALGHIHPTDDLPADGYWRWTGVPIRRRDNPALGNQGQLAFAPMLATGSSFPLGHDRASVGELRKPDTDSNSKYVHYGLAPTWPLMMSEVSDGQS
ncbi:MAG: hypothetical protein HUU60_03770 [Armatimonadetes bacterium]|nr:hypothetical protein [Armatimonadota bacterium]